jgi:hypothetical protein
MYGVVLVPSTSHAIRAEKLVQQAGIRCKLIPTPRQISSDCGIVLRFDWADHEQVERILRDRGVDYESIEMLLSGR